MNQDNSSSKYNLSDKIRKRIQSLHDDYYSADNTAKDPQKLVDKFWQEFKDHHDQHSAWQEFYHGLSDQDKNALWQEYHDIVKSSDEPGATFKASSKKTYSQFKNDIRKKLTPPKRTHQKQRLNNLNLKDRLKLHLGPLMSAIIAMVLVFSIGQNHLIIAKVKQYVSPGDTLASPIIVDPNDNLNISKEPRIIIPKINVDVPVVYDVKGYSEAAIQEGLERGVVHYGETALPGQIGNNVIVGHSSNNFFNQGKYKFAFVLLSQLENGDIFMLHYQGKRYVYKVFNKTVIEPDDFSLIQPTDEPITTLITCDPPGTSWRRLVVQAKQISPEIDSSAKKSKTRIQPDSGEVVPGSAPSIFDRIFSIF